MGQGAHFRSELERDRKITLFRAQKLLTSERGGPAEIFEIAYVLVDQKEFRAKMFEKA